MMARVVVRLLLCGILIGTALTGVCRPQVQSQPTSVAIRWQGVLTEPNGKVHSLDRGGVFGLAAPQGSSLSGITFTCDVPGETQTVRVLGAEPGSTGGWKLLAVYVLH